MTPPVTSLIKGILARVQEREGYVTKTKLVKYLYLFDVAAYRRTGVTITGLPWRFHLYGPWTEDCDVILQRMRSHGDITATPSNRHDIDTEFYRANDRIDLDDLVSDPLLALDFRHIVDMWADRQLGEMLNYVYFYTEPMDHAVRGAMLDFTSVNREEKTLPPPDTNKADKRQVDRLRSLIQGRKQLALRRPGERFTEPTYDQTYFKARELMDRDDDY